MYSHTLVTEDNKYIYCLFVYVLFFCNHGLLCFIINNNPDLMHMLILKFQSWLSAKTKINTDNRLTHLVLVNKEVRYACNIFTSRVINTVKQLFLAALSSLAHFLIYLSETCYSNFYYGFEFKG